MSGTLLVAGTSHQVAPVALREQLLGKSGERAAEALAAAACWRLGPGGSVVISTCNRLEVYCWTPGRRDRAARALTTLLASWSGLPEATLAPHLYVLTGQDAARHLIRVAAGLDSLAVGESQILGQVREAWQAARRGAPLGPELDGLFRRAIEAARRIRRQGGFDRHPSVAGIAVDAAGAALGTIGGVTGRPAAVLGAGVTGQAAAQALLAAGAAHVTILNRSPRRVATITGELPPERITLGALDALPAQLVAADVLVCATASPGPLVSAEAVAAAIADRSGRPLVIVDIAVPRDVDPAVRSLPGVRLLDLDDLAGPDEAGRGCARDAAARRQALNRATQEADAAAAAYTAELRLRRATPDILRLRRFGEETRQVVLRRFRGRLGNLTPAQQAALDQLTHTLVQKLLHQPTVTLRRTPSGRARRAILEYLTPLPLSPRSREGAGEGAQPRGPAPGQGRG